MANETPPKPARRAGRRRTPIRAAHRLPEGPVLRVAECAVHLSEPGRVETRDVAAPGHQGEQARRDRPRGRADRHRHRPRPATRPPMWWRCSRPASSPPTASSKRNTARCSTSTARASCSPTRARRSATWWPRAASRSWCCSTSTSTPSTPRSWPTKQARRGRRGQTDHPLRRALSNDRIARARCGPRCRLLGHGARAAAVPATATRSGSGDTTRSTWPRWSARENRPSCPASTCRQPLPPTADLGQALAEATAVLVVVPSQFFAMVLAQDGAAAGPRTRCLPGPPRASIPTPGGCSRGRDGDPRQRPLGVLSGPSFAAEVAGACRPR
jgi:hypothetical protein